MKNIKKTISIVLAIALVFALCACGNEGNAAKDTSEDEATNIPEQVAPAPTEAPAETASAAEEVTLEDLLALVGSPAEEAVKLLGDPASTDYASSCLGPGEDGEWEYDHFVVYTYKNEGSEEVVDVVAK